jgi:molybdopterin-containing oxidoreductase family iron-sulfur binding subunit
MKTIPPVCPEPETGRKYWRSLEELAETPEFKEWVEREFPAGASEWTDPLSRRNFVRIMSASFMLAGLGVAGSGCRRPEQRILPFAKMPENYVHGLPQFYATAMPTRGSAIPLVVKSTDGRPIKIEGNRLHPDSNGGTDRWAQASILNLYDPDRAQRFTSGGTIATADGASAALDTISKKAADNEGQGLSFLVERSSSPSRARLQKAIAEKFPHSRWYVYEPIDLGVKRRAASQTFGKPVKPYYLFDKANVIVSLDCDFIGSEEDAHNHIRRFAQGRHIEKPGDKLNRLYVVESLMTLTGFNSDHRLRIPCSAIAQFAAALASEVLKQGGGIAGLENIAKPAGVDPKWISECVADLAQNRGQSLIVAGYRQPLAVHVLAYAMNAALGNLGKTVIFHDAQQEKEGTIAELAQALNAGQVETLVILGGNPVYNAPADLDWAKTQRKAKMVVRLGYYEDETFPLCDWHLPAAHYLESWGDAQTSDGTLVPIQPLIAPLFGGLTELEVVARIAGEKVTSPYEIIRETFAGFISAGTDAEAPWRKFLHDGFLANTAAKPVEVKLNDVAVAQAVAAIKPSAPPSKNSLEVVFHRDYSVDDGRYNNNGWLQELPDPVTKLVWDNAVLVSRKTAQELGVKNSDMVEVKLGNATMRGPIWVQPGIADYSLGLALGYGREKTGRVGAGAGFNFYPLRTSAAENFAVGATVQPKNETYPISCPQTHWSLEGRPIIREVNLKQYEEHPNFAAALDLEKPPVVSPLYPNPLEKLKDGRLGTQTPGVHQWGMSIDLNKCVGCSACMMACQSENNVAIVGKDQVARGREMHWIRIDRYYAGDPNKEKPYETFRPERAQQFEEWIDDPQAVMQPMLCQHCEAAPCENVCPVNATVHDQEGLNVMVYNRCVGTRYCSNNCPYKVRRFNFFDWNKRPIGQFYRGPFGHRKDDEWDLLKMSKNPDVTVRMRGVMEKCTFCVQRIEQAKIAQKIKAGASADVVVPTDSFTTACAQACPAGAIVFGNLNDHNSRVWKQKQLDRNYTVLEFLLTKPRTTYLAKVRNPNPAMPDYEQYKEGPRTLQEYKRKMKTADPFEKKPEGEGHKEKA